LRHVPIRTSHESLADHLKLGEHIFCNIDICYELVHENFVHHDSAYETRVHILMGRQEA